jgi:hypothetical protein
MSKRTYPISNKNLSGSDYIQNKRAKQLFSGTSNLAKTIEEQNGNFPLLTPLGKQKPYQGTYGLSGRSVGSYKSYCLNTSHSYRDLLAITKGKYLLTPPNIANESEIQFKDVSNARKLYNGVYYVYTYNSNNLVAYMNPGYPNSPASYVANKIEYNPTTDASQRIIVDPSYVITYSSQSCVLTPSVVNNITISNEYESRYSFNRTINLDLLTGFQFPSKFELDYDSGDCINANNDMQTKYANPVPPVPPVQEVFFNTGGQGLQQTIIAWSNTGGITWVESDNGNSIFSNQVNSIKYDSGTNVWAALGGDSNSSNPVDPSANVVAFSYNGKFWNPSVATPNLTPPRNANEIFERVNSGEYYSLTPSKWIVVGKGRSVNINIIAPPIIVTPTIAFTSDQTNWFIATSTDASLNNPFGFNGLGVAVATNNSNSPISRVIAVGTGSYKSVAPISPTDDINMVVSIDGGSQWTRTPVVYSPGNINGVAKPAYTNQYPPKCIIYSPPLQKWHVGGTANGSTISPIYYSVVDASQNITWTTSNLVSPQIAQNVGICYSIAYRPPSTPSPLPYYVAVGDNIFGISNILYSYDGISWVPSNNGNTFKPLSVAWHDGVWVAVGSKSSLPSPAPPNVIAYSTNGINWTNSLNGDGLFLNGALGVGS